MRGEGSVSSWWLWRVFWRGRLEPRAVPGRRRCRAGAGQVLGIAEVGSRWEEPTGTESRASLGRTGKPGTGVGLRG